MKDIVIGVDIGGTKIATGAVSGGGEIIKKKILPTHAEKGREASFSQVVRSISEVLDEAGISAGETGGIGLCAPGPLDPDRGIVHNPPNLFGWKDVPLAGLIEEEFGVRTRLENDANAAGMAEVLWGAASGKKDVFYVTVSTGIGTAIIIGGRIYHGKNGMAGEGGHVTIDYKSEYTCNCGNIGCIETLASGPNTVKRLRDRFDRDKGLDSLLNDMAGGDPEGLTMEHIAEAARQGDRVALETVEEQGKLLGVWLGSMISLLDPEIIVIGGGVSLMGEMLFKPVRDNIPSRTINIFAEKTPVVQARLKKDVGILGAASIMKEEKAES
jgi:glucokinase